MLIEGIYLRHLTSLLFVRRSSILKRYSHNQPPACGRKDYFPPRKREIYGVLISIFLGDFFQFGEQMRTKEIHRQSVSQFIDSREGDEAELSTCELRGRNDKGRRAFLSFFFLSVFKKRTGVFAAGVREKTVLCETEWKCLGYR